jgi:hypothetical protein
VSEYQHVCHAATLVRIRSVRQWGKFKGKWHQAASALVQHAGPVQAMRKRHMF